MTNLRTVFVDRRTGLISVMTAAPKAKQKTESADAWLSRAEAKSNRETYSEFVEGKQRTQTVKQLVGRVDPKVNPFPHRGTRNAWRLDIPTGKVVVNMQIAYTLRKNRLTAEWIHWKKTVDDTLEFAQGFGDQASITLLTREQTRMAGIPALIRTELDRILADGDEAAMGSWEPNWPKLT